jgi:protein tyrosine phosphatase
MFDSFSDDTTRVHLSEGPDYINANYINVSLMYYSM